jgi:hypothetical protein
MYAEFLTSISISEPSVKELTRSVCTTGFKTTEDVETKNKQLSINSKKRISKSDRN